MGRNVVVDMRIRVGACCACLAVLGGTLSACSFGDDGAAPLPEDSAAADTAASSPAAVDPWTLPIEDRPELFNPCTEISLEDLAAAGLENPLSWPEAATGKASPPLKQCGWETKTMTLVVSSHWTEIDAIDTDVSEQKVERGERQGFDSVLLESRLTSTPLSCGLAIRSSRGLVAFDLATTTTDLFADNSDEDACARVEQTFSELFERIEGNLR